MQLLHLAAALGLAGQSLAGYTLVDDYLDNFFDKWDFFTGDDPTHGYANYVDRSTAEGSGYIKTNGDGSVYIGVDYTNTASGRGGARSDPAA